MTANARPTHGRAPNAGAGRSGGPSAPQGLQGTASLSARDARATKCWNNRARQYPGVDLSKYRAVFLLRQPGARTWGSSGFVWIAMVHMSSSKFSEVIRVTYVLLITLLVLTEKNPFKIGYFSQF